MNDENKNQKVVFLFNGDKKKIAEECLDTARTHLRCTGLSLRLALEGKSMKDDTLSYALDVSNNLINEGSFSVSKDGFCEGHALGRVAVELGYVYDKFFKRGSKKTKRYILDAMKHLLRFAELAGVDFFNLESVKTIYERQGKELEVRAAI